MQSQGMETPFFAVWNNALVVLQGTGHYGLTMSLQHRHVDHVIRLHGPITDPDLHSLAVIFRGAVLLQVHKGYIILPADLVITGHLESALGTAAYPGALHDHNVLKAMLPKIFNAAGQKLRVGCAAVRGRTVCHKIRLQRNLCILIRDFRGNVGSLQNLLHHLLIVAAVNNQNIVSLHKFSLLILLNLSCINTQSYTVFLHIFGENKISMGRISSLPASISKVSTSFESTE